jgi:restriction system protein
LAEIFRADHIRVVSNTTVNGFVTAADPATGRRSKVFLLTVTAARVAFTHLDLSQVDPVSCLEGLRGQLSSKPEDLKPVHPFQLATAAISEPSDDVGAGQSDLLTLDPIDFEDLVA